MAIKYEVTAVTGKYTDKQGNEKNRYTKMGVIMETKNGFALKIEAIPVAWDGWAYLNEPQAKDAREGGNKASKANQPISDENEDRIPF